MRRLPARPRRGGGGGSLPRRRPSMRRSPCPSLVEHAQTLVPPRAASGLGVEMVCPASLCAETPAPLPSFYDLLVLVCGQL